MNQRQAESTYIVSAEGWNDRFDCQTVLPYLKKYAICCTRKHFQEKTPRSKSVLRLYFNSRQAAEDARVKLYQLNRNQAFKLHVSSTSQNLQRQKYTHPNQKPSTHYEHRSQPYYDSKLRFRLPTLNQYQKNTSFHSQPSEEPYRANRVRKDYQRKRIQGRSPSNKSRDSHSRSGVREYATNSNRSRSRSRQRPYKRYQKPTLQRQRDNQDREKSTSYVNRNRQVEYGDRREGARSSNSNKKPFPSEKTNANISTQKPFQEDNTFSLEPSLAAHQANSCVQNTETSVLSHVDYIPEQASSLLLQPSVRIILPQKHHRYAPTSNTPCSNNGNGCLVGSESLSVVEESKNSTIPGFNVRDFRMEILKQAKLINVFLKIPTIVSQRLSNSFNTGILVETSNELSSQNGVRCEMKGNC